MDLFIPIVRSSSCSSKSPNCWLPRVSIAHPLAFAAYFDIVIATRSP